jgi:hypothetical protein
MKVQPEQLIYNIILMQENEQKLIIKIHGRFRRRHSSVYITAEYRLSRLAGLEFYRGNCRRGRTKCRGSLRQRRQFFAV